MKTRLRLTTQKRGIRLPLLVLALSLIYSNFLFAQSTDIRTILDSYARDYEKDVTLKNDVTFAIKVDDVFWHVIATAKTDSTQAIVKIIDGQPRVPTFYFKTDLGTLRKINEGKLNALTASAKAFESDFAPFDVDVLDGYIPDENFIDTLFKVYFHFWTRGLPEIIPYGIDLTRFTHGAQASIFYYQEGFRSAYVALKKGQHANKDERSRSNPFPTLLIAIKGKASMIINGVRSNISAGEAVIIPPGVSHEFLNENDETLEAILIMFGEGA